MPTAKQIAARKLVNPYQPVVKPVPSVQGTSFWLHVDRDGFTRRAEQHFETQPDHFYRPREFEGERRTPMPEPTTGEWIIEARLGDDPPTPVRRDGSVYLFPTRERAEAKAAALRSDPRFAAYHLTVIAFRPETHR